MIIFLVACSEIKESNYNTHSTFGGILYCFSYVYGLTMRSELTSAMCRDRWAYRYRHRFWHLFLIIWPSQWATVWLLIPNPHWPCWSKKRKGNYQKKAISRNAIRSITFMNYVMKEYTNLSYMSRRTGVFLQRLNEIYIDNTPGTHSDTCNIKTVPVILNGLWVQHVHFPPAFLGPHLSNASGYEVITQVCKKKKNQLHEIFLLNYMF